jgi:hypothetical protein
MLIHKRTRAGRPGDYGMVDERLLGTHFQVIEYWLLQKNGFLGHFKLKRLFLLHLQLPLTDRVARLKEIKEKPWTAGEKPPEKGVV